MPQNWTRLRASASDSVATLSELLADGGTDDRRLVLGYLEAKRVLAAAFEAFAVERYADSAVLENAKAAIEREMARLYPAVPAKYLKVRGYGEVHARLLAYLSQRAGTDVSAGELRMLTGDAVHTERRARELRDLGYALDARHVAETDVYVLQSNDPDLAAVCAYLVAKNIKGDKSLTKDEAAELLRSEGLQ
jgi:hypothetical protein